MTSSLIEAEFMLTQSLRGKLQLSDEDGVSLTQIDNPEEFKTIKLDALFWPLYESTEEIINGLRTNQTLLREQVKELLEKLGYTAVEYPINVDDIQDQLDDFEPGMDMEIIARAFEFQISDQNYGSLLSSIVSMLEGLKASFNSDPASNFAPYSEITILKSNHTPRGFNSDLERPDRVFVTLRSDGDILVKDVNGKSVNEAQSFYVSRMKNHKDFEALLQSMFCSNRRFAIAAMRKLLNYDYVHRTIKAVFFNDEIQDSLQFFEELSETEKSELLNELGKSI